MEMRHGNRYVFVCMQFDCVTNMNTIKFLSAVMMLPISTGLYSYEICVLHTHQDYTAVITHGHRVYLRFMKFFFIFIAYVVVFHTSYIVQ